MNVLVVWVPPQSSSIYHNQVYLYCRKCTKNIVSGTVIGLDDNDLQRLGHGETPYSAECTLCAIKTLMMNQDVKTALFETVREELKFGNVLREQVREELKKIIKEEVHDPQGAFSPDGSK